MASKIIWSENALADLEHLKSYLENNWPEFVLLNFLMCWLKNFKRLNNFQKQAAHPKKILTGERSIIETKHFNLFSSKQ